jgi:hypothetical protein
MAANRSRKTPALAPPLTEEELASRLRAALQIGGRKRAELAAVVGKAEGARALQLANDLAAAGELHSVSKGTTQWFFGADPRATLDRVVPELLRENGPSSAKELLGPVERAAPGHSWLLPEWLPNAIARRLVFELSVPGPSKKSKKKVLSAEPGSPPVSDDELIARLRTALQGTGLKSTDLMKVLGKEDGARALELARGLAASGNLHRVLKGTAEWFFVADPRATLDRVAPEVLRARGPSTPKELQHALERAAPGHSWLLPEWQPNAIARGLLFEVSLPGPPKKKLLNAEPDLKLSLGKALTELKKVLPALERQGISRDRALEFLRSELRGEAARRPSREVFLEALRRFAADSPKGTLLPVRELRARAGLGKQDFDTAALDLSNEGLLVLHHHDHAAALSEAEQSGLVRDALGRHYVGIALRGSA